MYFLKDLWENELKYLTFIKKKNQIILKPILDFKKCHYSNSKKYCSISNFEKCHYHYYGKSAHNILENLY